MSIHNFHGWPISNTMYHKQPEYQMKQSLVNNN